MNQIIPAILTGDENEFRSKLNLVDENADAMQIDVLDNTLYPNTSWCDMGVIDGLDTTAWLELHLMVSDPAQYIAQIKQGGPVHRVIWHIEAPVDHSDLLFTCQHLGLEAGLAIAPRTSIEALRPFADMLDEILVLGVEPGFSGQALIPETIERAREIHRHWPSMILGFDGGVNAHVIPQLRDAGVTRFYAASALWNAKDAKGELEKLRNI